MVFLVLFIFIAFILIIFILSKNYSSSIFDEILSNENFSNVNQIYSNSNMRIVRADSDGENFLFGVAKTYVSVNDISILYEKAHQLHIHNTILVYNYHIDSQSIIYKKAKSYGIEIWDEKKLYSLCSNSNRVNYNTSSRDISILRTSDVSDDSCDISDSSDPIQEKQGFFSSLFGDKIERL